MVEVVGFGEFGSSRKVVGDQQKFNAGIVRSCFVEFKQMVVSGVRIVFAGVIFNETVLVMVSEHEPF